MAMNTEVLSVILQIYFKMKRNPEFKKEEENANDLVTKPSRYFFK